MISAAKGMPILSKTSTKGALDTPASFIGKSDAKTTIGNTNHITKRPFVFLIALGTAYLGFFVSPAAIPMSSVPEKA